VPSRNANLLVVGPAHSLIGGLSCVLHRPGHQPLRRLQTPEAIRTEPKATKTLQVEWSGQFEERGLACSSARQAAWPRSRASARFWAFFSRLSLACTSRRLSLFLICDGSVASAFSFLPFRPLLPSPSSPGGGAESAGCCFLLFSFAIAGGGCCSWRREGLSGGGVGG
jgi:hypothetical protein